MASERMDVPLRDMPIMNMGATIVSFCAFISLKVSIFYIIASPDLYMERQKNKRPGIAVLSPTRSRGLPSGHGLYPLCD